MVPEVLDGLLWLVRLGLRAGPAGIHAGHGYADPSFRPARLPFVSLIGPLCVEVEPESDPPKPSDVLVQLPGFVLGEPRAAEVLPSGQTLSLVADGDASCTITIPIGADFSDDAQVEALCASVQAELRSAATTGGFQDGSGAPVIDPEKVAELEQLTCRWDRSSRFVAIASGRRGYVDEVQASTVEVSGGTAAPAMGLDPPAKTAEGRFTRQRAPAPKGFTVDFRLDLWAANQRGLGYLVDTLIRTVPVRAQVATRPALLAVDTAPGSREIRLLSRGEPTLDRSLFHVELPDGFVDRVTGRAMATTAGATAESGPDRLRFSGSGTARLVLVATPVIPDPRRPEHPAPRGISVGMGLVLDGASNNDQGTLLAIEHEGSDLVRLTYEVDNEGSDLFVDLTLEADLHVASGGTARASLTRRVPLPRLEQGTDLHLALDAARGRVSIQLDGDTQDLADAAISVAGPDDEPGVPVGGDGLELVIGDPDGAPLAFELTHLHVVAEPFLALDPRLRASTSPASRFRPGDRIALGYSADGRLPRGDTEAFYVRSVAGDRVELDRPIDRAWGRGSTLVFSRAHFLHQRQMKRRDDLMNRLYRYSVGYRVSALLEQRETPISGTLVATPVVELEMNTPTSRSAARTGTAAADRPPTRIASGSIQE